MEPSNSITQDLWATARGREKGLPLIFRFRQHLPFGADVSIYPTLINIYWRFDGSRNNGMPLRSDNEKQIAFEDAVAPLDEMEQLGYLMLVVTGNSRKEWIHYVKDKNAWLARFNELLAEHPVYPIEIETEVDAGWNTWREIAKCAQN